MKRRILTGASCSATLSRMLPRTIGILRMLWVRQKAAYAALPSFLSVLEEKYEEKKMKVLYVDIDDSTKGIAYIMRRLRGVEFEGFYLPREIYRGASPSFATEAELVELLRIHDGAVLDCQTFGDERVRGGPGSVLPRYLEAIQQSGYEGRIVVTTAISSRGVDETVLRAHPQATVLTKPFAVSDLLVALGERPL